MTSPVLPLKESPTPMPIHPGVRIGHVHLKVADLDRALGFYCGVLGLVLASPVAILIRADLAGTTVGMAIISVITFAVGFVGAWLLDKGNKSA